MSTFSCDRVILIELLRKMLENYMDAKKFQVIVYFGVLLKGFYILSRINNVNYVMDI